MLKINISNEILHKIIVGFIIIIVLTSCQGRDLSTPSKRLVGHWLSDKQGWHEFYSPVDPITKTGTFVQVDDSDAFYAQYRLISENLDGTHVKIQLLTLNDTLPEIEMEWDIDMDGIKRKHAEYPSNSWTYVDNKTEP